MSDKRRNGGTKALRTLAAFAAAFATRQLIALVWKRVTGREPPTDTDDPQVGIGEALGWAVVSAVGIEAARLLASRAATRKAKRTADLRGQ